MKELPVYTSSMITDVEEAFNRLVELWGEYEKATAKMLNRRSGIRNARNEEQSRQLKAAQVFYKTRLPSRHPLNKPLLDLSSFLRCNFF